MDHLSTQDIVDADLADWRKLAQRLHARFRAGNPGVGAAFLADAVNAASEASLADHLEASLDATHVDLRVASHLGSDGIWVRDDDVTLARLLSDVARRHEVASVPPRSARSSSRSTPRPTTGSVRSGPRCSLGTPARSCTTRCSTRPGQLPSVWFQGTEPHEAPRQRWHPDVWVAPEVADARIAAAVAAGGAVVDDSGAPSFTILGDPDGNKVCVCTSLGRA